MQALRRLLIFTVLVALAAEADAQRFRRGYYYAPYGVTARPHGYSFRTPYYSYGVRPAATSPSGYTVRYGWPGGSVEVDTAVVPTPAIELDEAPSYEPSAPQIDGDLIAQLNQAIAILNARFEDFDGGAGWQRYLTPADVDAANPAFREMLLRRVDSVASDSKYQAVSQLVEFQKVYELLQVVSASPATPQRPVLPTAPMEAEPAAGAEPIPAPMAAPESSTQPKDATGERSVLAR